MSAAGHIVKSVQVFGVIASRVSIFAAHRTALASYFGGRLVAVSR